MHEKQTTLIKCSTGYAVHIPIEIVEKLKLKAGDRFLEEISIGADWPVLTLTKTRKPGEHRHPVIMHGPRRIRAYIRKDWVQARGLSWGSVVTLSFDGKFLYLA